MFAALCSRPSHVPEKYRARGAKAAGLRYERALAEALPFAKHGLWFEFRDANGKGHCQPDLLLELPRAIVVLECKYTWVAEGHSQIEQLYRPVVEKALRKPVVGMVVCKNLVPGCPWPVRRTLEDALEVGGPVVLHWIGVGPATRQTTVGDAHAMAVDGGTRPAYRDSAEALGL